MEVFVNEDYLDYKYLVSVSDNYIVLTDQNEAENEQIDIIYQYINPSIITIEGKRNIYGYQEYKKINVTDNFWNRADTPKIVIAGLSVTLLLLFVINGVTRLVKKGGVFFGS